MRKFRVRYVCWVAIEVDAPTEDEAGMMADKYLLDMTGADFRECTEWDGVDEIIEEAV